MNNFEVTSVSCIAINVQAGNTSILFVAFQVIPKNLTDLPSLYIDPRQSSSLSDRIVTTGKHKQKPEDEVDDDQGEDFRIHDNAVD